MLAETIQHGGDPKLHDVTLADVGIEKVQSHRWQRIASIPEPTFEEFLGETRDEGEP